MNEQRLVLAHLFGDGQSFDDMQWQPMRPGIEIARLYGDGSWGPSAALLRYAKGARLPRHRHTGYEHIFVLRGSQRDENGTYPAGSCLIHGEHTAHSVTSDDGCVVLAVWQGPVLFLD
ncbi:MAG TPA: cupin domain-containing protein [Polyangiales bacterium]|jgi:anti-sigma factor ChrR (cupin superfamily)